MTQSRSIAMSDLGDEYIRIFGPPDEEREAGRRRLCRVCGDWHSLDRPWPHNCRSEPPPRADLAAPQLAPAFQPFVVNTATGEHIGDRREERSWMDRNDAVHHEAGVKPEREPTRLEFREELSRDIDRALQTDPLSKPPTPVIGRGNLGGAPDVDITGIEVAT